MNKRRTFILASFFVLVGTITAVASDFSVSALGFAAPAVRDRNNLTDVELGAIILDTSASPFTFWGKYGSGGSDWTQLDGAGSSTPVGLMMPYAGSTAPTGYILASGRTIGSASSGATERADADTESLYTLLWNSWSNAELPIQDSSGTATTRGASAAADFAANKRLPVPDLRGRVPAGKDNMGGTAANRLVSGSGLDGSTLGASGGTQTHTLVVNEIPSHSHDIATGSFSGNAAHDHSGGVMNPIAKAANLTSANNTDSSNATGGGLPHNITQPTLVMSYIIKL